jgi:hypothetical protein
VISLLEVLHELRAKKSRIDKAITVIESRLARQQRVPRCKRGRKGMGTEERKVVSARMKLGAAQTSASISAARPVRRRGARKQESQKVRHGVKKEECRKEVVRLWLQQPKGVRSGNNAAVAFYRWLESSHPELLSSARSGDRYQQLKDDLRGYLRTDQL